MSDWVVVIEFEVQLNGDAVLALMKQPRSNILKLQ